MHPLIIQHQEEIRELCREFGVIRLELFGSAATGAFDPERSDFDFIVEYPPDYEYGNWLSRYFELRDRLAALSGRPVDLVMADAIRKPGFLRSVNASRQDVFVNAEAIQRTA
jgi:predicted nucleotidyltransferase